MPKITDFSLLKNLNGIIEEFKGEYRWLSNFWNVPIEYNGIIYPSVEHAYVSAKINSEQWKRECADARLSSAEVKQKGYGKEDETWSDIKISVMKECLIKKFNQEPFRTNLINTGKKYIQEGNRWNDTFWGFCLKTNLGQNNLGKLIMEIRDDLQKEVLSNDN